MQGRIQTQLHEGPGRVAVPPHPGLPPIGPRRAPVGGSPPSERLAYTVDDLVAQGLPRGSVRRLMRLGEIRSRKVGRQYLLDPEDVRRVFGFEEPAESTGLPDDADGVMADVPFRIVPARQVHGPGWARRNPKAADELWIVATVNGERLRRKLGPDTPETWERAAKARAEVERELRFRTAGSASASVPTLGDLSEHYLDKGLRGRALGTWRRRRAQLGDFAQRFGDRRLDEITAADLQSWWVDFVDRGRRDLRTGLGHLEGLSQLYEHATDLGYELENPVPSVRRRIRRQASRTKALRGRDEQNCRPLCAADLRAFAAALAAHHKLDVTIAGFLMLDAGLRIGEALALRWSSIELGADENDTARRLIVERSMDAHGVVSSPKNGTRRMVPMSRRLRALLVARRAQADRRLDPAEARVLRMTSHKAYRSGLADVARAARLRREVRPKDLRDSFASQLLTAGVPVAWIAKRLGHGNIAVTVRHYANWVDEDGYRNPLVVEPGELPPDLLARIE